MKQDEYKIQDDPEIIYDTLLKVDIIEGQSVYIVSNSYVNKIQTKTNFKFGQICLYSENSKHVSMYRGDINSTVSFNQEIEWDQKYLEKIKTVLENGGKDYKYSFKSSDEENLSDLTFTLKINERIFLTGSKKQISSEVQILKVNMNLIPLASYLDSIFQIFFDINSRKKQKLTELTQNIQQIEKQRQDLVQELERTNSMKRKQETELQSKCAFLLNKKKNKIRELCQAKDTCQQQQIDELINVIDDHTSPKKSNGLTDPQQVETTKLENVQQDTTKIKNGQQTTLSEFNGVSQQLVSQPLTMGSLFEPSMQINKRIKNQTLTIIAKEESPPPKEEDEDVEHVKFEDYEDFMDAPKKKIKQ